ncbi:MAG: hypothetical protein H5T64_10670, partial [Chloroflexi bacterium]|nr:hypothetical protein [Chloroflexota bacterium]
MRWRAFTVLSVIVGLVLVLTSSATARAPQPPDTPPAAINQSGELVSLSGWFTVIWGDPEPESNTTVDTIYMLFDDRGQATRLLLTEELIQPLGGVLALNGRRLTVVGIWADATAEVAQIPALLVQSIQVDFEAVSALISAPVSGSQPWVTILCKFADVAAEPQPLSYFQGLMGSAYPGMDHYWRELSYNVIKLVGSVERGWYTLPQPKSYYVYGSPAELDLARATEDCTACADADVYFPSYVGINLVFNDALGYYVGWGCASYYLVRDGEGKYYRMTWLSPPGQDGIAHEMGHGFGLPHSGPWYDNQWDVMSDSWGSCRRNNPDPTYGCVGQHTISYHKDMLGWVPVGRKYTVALGSQATIALEQLALPQTNNYLMVQIPIAGSGSHFYSVEARRLVGYDNCLPGDAVIIHDVNTSRSDWGPAYVVDADWNGNTGDAGAMWTVDETFTDAENGISVSVVSATSTGFVVYVNNNYVPTPGERADVDADGKRDLVLWRPSNGTWYALKSSAGYAYGSSFTRSWGKSG